MVDCKSFFLSGIENREGQWNINSPVYIWAHLISCLTLICPEPETKFASFFKAAQDQFHFLLSEESEGITL